MKFLFFLLIFMCPQTLWAQITEDGQLTVTEDDLNLGGDIFNDFNEDLENTQIMDDERFYRYGRFFTFNVSLGITDYSGNRGIAYENDHPTYGFSLYYFLDFQTSFGLGLAFSKHHMFIEEPTFKYSEPLGVVDVSMLRTFFSYRYYIDTADLGTAITYSNPYFIARLEYWILTNSFISQSGMDNDVGGGIGIGVGFGLEFPIRLKESYIGLEFLYHNVNYHDRYTQDYAAPESNPNGPGHPDLTGASISSIVSYVFNW